MIEFAYKAKSASGSATTGTISATTAAEARTLLRGDGLFPLSVSSITRPVRVRKKKRSTRVSKPDLLMVTSQLSIMSRSGVDLADALRGVAEECDNSILQAALQQVYDDVSGGDTVSSSLAKHRKIFGETYIVAIQAGEASGQMTDVLLRLTRLLQFEIKLRNSISGVLIYPVILFTVASLVSTAMILFVLPQFAKVFEDLARPVPASTQFLLDVSLFTRSNLFILLPSLLVAAMLFWQAMKTERFRLWFDTAILRVRGFGPAVQALSSGRLFTLMGTMLQSGIPLLDALTLCRTATGNRLLQNLFAKLEDEVVKGQGISPTLKTAECIPGGAYQMISTAERSGRLAEVVETVGEFYEEEGERKIRQAVKILEPAIILAMGVFVSFIVMSVMLPLLDVSTVN